MFEEFFRANPPENGIIAEKERVNAIKSDVMAKIGKRNGRRLKPLISAALISAAAAVCAVVPSAGRSVGEPVSFSFNGETYSGEYYDSTSSDGYRTIRFNGTIPYTDSFIFILDTAAEDGDVRVMTDESLRGELFSREGRTDTERYTELEEKYAITDTKVGEIGVTVEKCESCPDHTKEKTGRHTYTVHLGGNVLRSRGEVREKCFERRADGQSMMLSYSVTYYVG